MVDDFLATRVSFAALDRDDLVQEGLLHWWRQRFLYSPARGASVETFMRRVLKAKLLDLAERETAAKRGGYSRPLPLDAPISGSDRDEPLTPADVLRDEDLENDPEVAAERTARRELVDRALRLLEPRQRLVADGLLSGRTMSEISAMLGVPRPTLYDERDRIEQVFRNEDLQEWLN